MIRQLRSRMRRTTSHTGTGRVRQRTRAWGYGAVGIATTFVVWLVLSRYVAGTIGNLDRLAGPGDVARSVADYATGDMVADVLASLKVFLGGWVVGGGGAILLGLLFGTVRVVGATFMPLIEAIRPVSSIAWLPMSIVWFGFGLVAKSFVVGLAVFLVVIVYVVDGSSRIPADVERTASMLGMSRVRHFFNVTLPATLAEALIGLRVSLVAGWGTVVIAELVAANTGLGAHLVRSQQGFNIAEVMATMFVFGASGFLLDAAFSVLQSRLLSWRSADA